MKITVIGSGYVGLVTGACLADAGNDVLCLDIDSAKISRLLNGEVPIYEPGLDVIISRCIKKRTLSFTTDVKESVKHGDVQFISVGTPQDEDGSADLSYVLRAAENIGQLADRRLIVVVKSTVPVGTCDEVQRSIDSALQSRGLPLDVPVVSNPEFLREGDAVRDFKFPDRVVIGGSSQWALGIMRALYEPFCDANRPILVMDTRSSELSKYTANAMLATRISFMNEIANLAERLGANIEDVRRAIAADSRIGKQFLNAGCGYGGSCFPKDVAALIRFSEERWGYNLRIVSAVSDVNIAQRKLLVEKVKKRFGESLLGYKFAIWGLAFKPDTDDMREAPALTVVSKLIAAGAEISAFDPIAGAEAGRLFSEYEEKINISSSAFDGLESCDALLILTEWAEFRNADLDEVRRSLKGKVVFDGRNIWDPEEVRLSGLEYYSVGRPPVNAR